MVAFVGQVAEVIVDTVFVIAHGAAAVVIAGDEAVFTLIWLYIEQDVDRSRFRTGAEGDFGVSFGQIRQEPDGAFQIGPGHVIAMLHELRLPVQGLITDTFCMVLAVAALLACMVLYGHIVDAADDDVIRDDAVSDILCRQVCLGDEIAVAAEVLGQRIGPLLQVGKGQVFPLLIGQEFLQFLVFDDVLTGNLEFIDPDFRRRIHIQCRLLPFRNLHGTAAIGNL